MVYIGDGRGNVLGSNVKYDPQKDPTANMSLKEIGDFYAKDVENKVTEIHFVVEGGKCKCLFGTHSAMIKATHPSSTTFSGKKALTLSCTKMKNEDIFGACAILTAIKIAKEKLKGNEGNIPPVQCKDEHDFDGNWKKSVVKVTSNDKNTLQVSSKLRCKKGGIISITRNGQAGSFDFAREGLESIATTVWNYTPYLKNGLNLFFDRDLETLQPLSDYGRFTNYVGLALDAGVIGAVADKLNDSGLFKKSLNTLDDFFDKKASGADDVLSGSKNGKKYTLDKNKSTGNATYKKASGADDIFKSTPELENHLKYTDPTVPRKRGIGGAHNSEEFFKNDVKIVSQKPTDVSGVSVVEYQIPELDMKGLPTGNYKKTVFKKSIYDPSIMPDDEYVRRGLEAANNAAKNNNGSIPREWVGKDSSGKIWRGYYKDGKPDSFFPD